MNFKEFIKLLWALDGSGSFSDFEVDFEEAGGDVISEISIRYDEQKIIIFK